MGLVQKSRSRLWPLCHRAFVKPVFRPADLDSYWAANAKFADAVCAERGVHHGKINLISVDLDAGHHHTGPGGHGYTRRHERGGHGAETPD